MRTTPLAQVKERFKTKEALVKEVQNLSGDDLWIDRLNEDKGLDLVSNAKLLRLHAVLSEVKSTFGSRAKLIDSILQAKSRSKDADYRKALEGHSTPRLLDLHRAATKKK